MRIYLLDMNKNMCEAWEKRFNGIKDVTIVNDTFDKFMDTHLDVDCVVSPANAFGLMDGGYDGAITRYFGPDLSASVRGVILDKWYGEQPVGTSISVPIVNLNFKISKDVIKRGILIHTPTMRTPEIIIDDRIIYQCMRTTLIEAINNKVDVIVIPAFGGSCGRVDFERIARHMYLAYKSIFLNPPKSINWNVAYAQSNQLLF